MAFIRFRSGTAKTKCAKQAAASIVFGNQTIGLLNM